MNTDREIIALFPVGIPQGFIAEIVPCVPMKLLSMYSKRQGNIVSAQVEPISLKHVAKADQTNADTSFFLCVLCKSNFLRKGINTP